ncbi:MAG: polyphosphate kinase 2 [Pseudomonadota bacterium]
MAKDAQDIRSFELGTYPYSERMKRKAYEATLQRLQIELLKVQRWTKETGQRFLLIFEGRDAAGKGGTIKRFTQHLNPRGARVVALAKPSDVERTQWYFQRYVPHLPSGGEIVFFDRSWYNRAGVERVMGFCESSDWQRFFREAPQFEDMLVESGIRLTKFWLTVTQKEQHRRFEDRRNDPLKRWKLSPIDEASLDKWDAYSEAREAMFDHTDTARAPWTVVKTDDKRRARIACISHVLRDLEYPDKDADAIPDADPLIITSAASARREV